jgi:hypothetical protein
MLNKFERGTDIDFFTDLIICWGILFGPVTFPVSALVMISSISIGQVGFIINEKGLVFFK